MAINDVLSLKAARYDHTANSKCFGVPEHQQPNFDGFIYIHYEAPSYSGHKRSPTKLCRTGGGKWRWCERNLPPSVWHSLVELRLLMSVCDAWQRNKTQNLLRRVAENLGPILSHLFTKVHEIYGQCREPLVLSNILVRLSLSFLFRRYSPLSLEVVEKTNKCKSFLAPNFLGGMTLTFLRQIVSAIYCPSFGKVWLSSVC